MGSGRRLPKQDNGCDTTISPFLGPLSLRLTPIFISPPMSSSSPSASCSRSPSPTNPATPDSSDSLETVAFDSNFGFSSWYQSLAQGKLLGTDTLWADGQSQFREMTREDEGNILSLDELIKDSAY